MKNLLLIVAVILTTGCEALRTQLREIIGYRSRTAGNTDSNITINIGQGAGVNASDRRPGIEIKVGGVVGYDSTGGGFKGAKADVKAGGL